jgi:hypothetical protein
MDARQTDGLVALGRRGAILILTLATAAIHASLGGTLFLLNAVGYTTLAIVLLLPGPVRRVHWLARLALLGFAATTILAWVFLGARFPLAYLDKAIELALVALLVVEIARSDGGPLTLLRRARRLVADLWAMAGSRA